MKQTNLMSFIESTINILVGFGIACIAQAIFLPMLGVPIPWSANFAFAAIMTVISIGRSFLLRRVFEALHIRRPLSPMMQAIVAEKFRQVEVEGYDAAHDDSLVTTYLSDYAIHYAERWRDEQHDSDKRRHLVKAGALIIAEGEKFDRARKGKRRVEKVAA